MESSSVSRRMMTLDASVFIAALKADERYSEQCREVIRKVPRVFVLSEPSVVYQEVCGTVARRVGLDAAEAVSSLLDGLVHPRLLLDCGRSFCLSAYPLCAEFGIYSVDALYLRTAMVTDAVIVSLDREDFVEKVKENPYDTEVYHPSDFPY